MSKRKRSELSDTDDANTGDIKVKLQRLNEDENVHSMEKSDSDNREATKVSAGRFVFTWLNECNYLIILLHFI